MQCCRDCLYFQQPDFWKREAWGECQAPLPIWFTRITKDNHVRTSQGQDCRCFIARPAEEEELTCDPDDYPLY